MTRLTLVGYAINGRGMGHLVRQLAILRWARRLGEVVDTRVECWVLTTSEADTLARREGIPALKMPSKSMIRDAGMAPHRYLAVARTWVMNAIASIRPDALLVDTFPGGSFGELVTALEMARTRILVARRVRADFESEEAYQALLPLYDRILHPDERDVGPILIREREELLGRLDARRALGIPGDTRAVYLSLGGGGDPAVPDLLPRATALLRAEGWHVVVGAGPLYAGEEIRGDGITWLDRYVPMELLPGVDAAVSAGGYNSFHELMYTGVPTVFLPQPRIADDQAARARRAEEAGAGRVATSLEQVPELLREPGDPEAARRLVPDNGARVAAAAVLSLLMPPEDVEHAARLLTPEVMGQLHSGGWSPGEGLQVIRLLSGPGPARPSRRRWLLASLEDLGSGTSELPAEDAGAGARASAFFGLCRELRVPTALAVKLLQALHTKFPAARGAPLLAGVQALFTAWAPFDDWMGAISLMRAVPVQRQLSLEPFAGELTAWLEGQESLFDAVRDFARLEGGGRRSVAETLRLLRSGSADDPEAR